jgi:hypothetical protein
MKHNGGNWFTRKSKITSSRSNRTNITISDNVIYLDPIKSKNAFQCVYLPPYKQSPVLICNRINEIYKALNNKKVITSCSFNDRIKNRINKIQEFAENYSRNNEIASNFKDLCDKFLELQVYILVCRNQWNNRFAGLTLAGNVIGNVIK